jgi:hypothetical protein
MRRSIVDFVVVLTLITCAIPAYAGRIAGFTVTPTDLPTEVTAPIVAGTTENELKVRLAESGRWVFEGDILLAAAPDPALRKTYTFVFDTIELKNGARIITNGNNLVLIVNRLNIGNGKIIAFPEAFKTAAAGPSGVNPGEPGQLGQRGIGAGTVSIHVVDRVNGFLDVDLNGQAGGEGGNGAKGAKGATGADGSKGLSTLFDCRQGGGNGADGGAGAPGGNAGAGGGGGDGGTLHIYTIGSEPLPPAAFKLVAVGGPAGAKGTPGAGGDGGDGGRRGGGDGHCSGGERDGQTGPRGREGFAAGDVLKGIDGTAIVEAINLQTMLQEIVR